MLQAGQIGQHCVPTSMKGDSYIGHAPSDSMHAFRGVPPSFQSTKIIADADLYYVHHTSCEIQEKSVEVVVRLYFVYLTLA